jgi:hypothetical protein
MVGLGGLEPPTSPLSGARSSHLSYRPEAKKYVEILTGERGPAQLQALRGTLGAKNSASTAQSRPLAPACSLRVIL